MTEIFGLFLPYPPDSILLALAVTVVYHCLLGLFDG